MYWITTMAATTTKSKAAITSSTKKYNLVLIFLTVYLGSALGSTNANFLL